MDKVTKITFVYFLPDHVWPAKVVCSPSVFGLSRFDLLQLSTAIAADTLLSRVVISHCQTRLRDSFTDGEDVARIPTNHWLAEVVTVLATGAAAPHRQVDRSPLKEIQNLPVGGSVVPLAQRRHEDPQGEHRVVERRPRPFVLAASGTVGLV